MNYSKAIRIARTLADMPQRVLAERVSLDPSLISMFESGKRKPSLETLERIADALGIPFHLFTLLGAEPQDLRTKDSEAMHQLATGLTKLLLGGEQHDPIINDATGRKAEYHERKPARRTAQDPKRKAS